MILNPAVLKQGLVRVSVVCVKAEPLLTSLFTSITHTLPGAVL